MSTDLPLNRRQFLRRTAAGANGGITEARRLIEIAQRAGLILLSGGLTDPDLSLAASLALYGAHDWHCPAALNGPQFLNASILKQPFTVKDGELAVPTRAGETEGLAIFCDPKNRWHPAPWFTHDYGFFSPTPRWWLEQGSVEFVPGEKLHLRYRVLIHAGAPSGEQLLAEDPRWVVR